MRLFRRSKLPEVLPSVHDDLADQDHDDFAGGDSHYDDYEPSWYVPHDGDKTRFHGPDGLPALHLITYTDGGGETVLRLCEDSTGLLVGPKDSRLPYVGVYVSQLRGEFYHQEGCTAGDFSPGRQVALVREPANPFDKNAVAVYDATGTHLAAYANKQKARMLSKLIDAGETLRAISLRGTEAGIECEQIAILATTPHVLVRLMEARRSTLPRPAHTRPSGQATLLRKSP